MLRTSILLAALLLLPVFLGAQNQGSQADGAAKPPKEQVSAQALFDQLTAEHCRQKTRYRVARTAAQRSDAYVSARKRRDNQAAIAILQKIPRPDPIALAGTALAAAHQMKGDDRVKLISWAAVNSRDNDIIESVLAEVHAKHLGEPSVTVLLEQGTALRRCVGPDLVRKLADGVIGASPHDLAKAWAMYCKANMVGGGRGLTPAERGESQRLLDEAERLAKGTLLGDRIGSWRFRKANLQVGMVAPNIEGVDVDGEPLALHDYRGKVTVVDFWGFWCNLTQMLPRRLAMVKRHKGKAFALVGVSSDEDPGYYREQVQKLDVTWRSFWQGPRGVGGRIASKWGITGWPTSFVLDHKGVIRHVGLRGEALEKAVDELLSKVEPKAGK